MSGQGSVQSALLPLAMIWLAVHALLLAVILSAKFLVTKTVLVALLGIGILAFLFTQIQAKPRKLLHSP